MKNRKKIYELIIAYAILIGINYLFYTDDIGFHNLKLNPIWLIILLFSAKYGTTYGVLSAIIGSFYYLNTNFSAFFIDIFYLPDYNRINYVVFFLIVSVLIGQIGSKFNKRIEELNVKNEDLQEEFDKIKKHRNSLQTVNQELEKRIVGSAATIPSLYNLAKKMEKFSVEELSDSVLDIVSEFIETERTSLYLLDGDVLVLKAHKGWENTETLSQMEDLDSGFMGKAVRERKLVSILDSDQGNIVTEEEEGKMHLQFFKESRIASIPIQVEDRRVVGVINIDKIAFHRFNSHSLRMFKIISDWVALSFANAYSYMDADNMRIEDYKTNVYSYNYLTRVLSRDFLCAKRYKFDVTFMIIELQDFHSMKEKDEVLVLLAMTLYMVLRATDVIGRYKYEGAFAVMFPFLQAKDFEGIKVRLLDVLNNFHVKPYPDSDRHINVKMGVSFLNENHNIFEDIMGEAELNVSAIK